jgi:hypothetical protein
MVCADLTDSRDESNFEIKKDNVKLYVVADGCSQKQNVVEKEITPLSLQLLNPNTSLASSLSDIPVCGAPGCDLRLRSNIAFEPTQPSSLASSSSQLRETTTNGQPSSPRVDKRPLNEPPNGSENEPEETETPQKKQRQTLLSQFSSWLNNDRYPKNGGNKNTKTYKKKYIKNKINKTRGNKNINNKMNNTRSNKKLNKKHTNTLRKK